MQIEKRRGGMGLVPGFERRMGNGVRRGVWVFVGKERGAGKEDEVVCINRERQRRDGGDGWVYVFVN